MNILELIFDMILDSSIVSDIELRVEKLIYLQDTIIGLDKRMTEMIREVIYIIDSIEDEQELIKLRADLIKLWKTKYNYSDRDIELMCKWIFQKKKHIFEKYDNK